MSNYKLFLSCAASLLLMSGCYDLDLYPEDELSSGTFFQTQDHADQAMMAIYNQMTDNDVFGRQFGFDCLGSVASGFDGPSYPNIGRGTYTTSESAVSGKFEALYEGIARANVVLQNVDNCDMDDDLNTQYKAEARFMRALYYFELLNYWGGVPIYDESTVVAEEFLNMTLPRNTAEEVRAFIIADLDEAIASLPDEWDTENYGRATSGAANALKGKVLLYNEQYDEAATYFETVINSGLYALYSDYAGLFEPEGDASSEMIFAVQNIGGVGQDYGMPTTFYMGSRSSYGSCWNNVMAATDFVDSYEWKDGRPFDWEEVIPGFNESDDIKAETFYATLTSDATEVETYPEARETLLEMYDQRDPRMQASVIMPYTWYEGFVSNAAVDCEYVIDREKAVSEYNAFIRVQGNYEYYLWRKFVAKYDMDGAINNRQDTPINFPIIRYADVLLMLAECYNEMGRGVDAISLVNQVRARVDMPAINSGPEYLEVGDDYSKIFERIKHEREVELAAEGHSFNDMKRWGLLETLEGEVKGFTGTYYYTRVVRERDYLWPIPQSEMERNPNMEQNPGW